MPRKTLWMTCVAAIALSWVGCGRAQGASGSGAAARQGAKGGKNATGRWRQLSAAERSVIVGCGTERPFTGRFVHHKAKGTYTCGRCRSPLFRSKAKFNSGSGWPSFDDAIPGAVRELKDKDGRRVEIRCARCDGHLGHVFRGERMTKKNTRHCVNSVSLGFTAKANIQEAFYAGGCFWGVEHLLESVPGVVDVTSGYMGGRVDKPTYRQVSSGRTGHAETVRVQFDADKVSFETLTRRFFEIHDPTQSNRQGPDRGPQYRSAIYFTDSTQRAIVRTLISKLKSRGYAVVTEVAPAGQFWPAEAYHQNYYRRKGSAPYCHSYTPRFATKRRGVRADKAK